MLHVTDVNTTAAQVMLKLVTRCILSQVICQTESCENVFNSVIQHHHLNNDNLSSNKQGAPAPELFQFQKMLYIFVLIDSLCHR